MPKSPYPHLTNFARIWDDVVTQAALDLVEAWKGARSRADLEPGLCRLRAALDQQEAEMAEKAKEVANA